MDTIFHQLASLLEYIHRSFERVSAAQVEVSFLDYAAAPLLAVLIYILHACHS
jgi:hypothetical protein